MQDEEKWRRYRFMAMAMAKLIRIDDTLDFVRCCGDCVCDQCGLTYFDHPEVFDGVLHIGCDGKLLKL